MTWQKLTDAASAATGGGRGGAPMLRFSPIVDGYVLPVQVRETMAQGKQNDVPTLTGINAGELGGLMGLQSPPTAESFIGRARQQYGSLADEIHTIRIPIIDDDRHRRSACSRALSREGGARLNADPILFFVRTLLVIPRPSYSSTS